LDLVAWPLDTGAKAGLGVSMPACESFGDAIKEQADRILLAM
jgi:hypothetical protein